MEPQSPGASAEAGGPTAGGSLVDLLVRPLAVHEDMAGTALSRAASLLRAVEDAVAAEKSATETSAVYVSFMYADAQLRRANELQSRRTRLWADLTDQSTSEVEPTKLREIRTILADEKSALERLSRDAESAFADDWPHGLSALFGQLAAESREVIRRLSSIDYTVRHICDIIGGLKEDLPQLSSDDLSSSRDGLIVGTGSVEDLQEQDVSSADQALSDLTSAVSLSDLLDHPDVKKVRLLEEIGRATAALAAIEERRTELVRSARAAGLSWIKIGAAVGVTSQAAYRRWDLDARQRHRNYAAKQDDAAELD